MKTEGNFVHSLISLDSILDGELDGEAWDIGFDMMFVWIEYKCKANYAWTAIRVVRYVVEKKEMKPYWFRQYYDSLFV